MQPDVFLRGEGKRLLRQNLREMSKKRGFFYIYLCFFLSGLTSLVYETIWTRMLSLIFGHTVLAISTVLAVFMGGLALGSYLLGRWVDDSRRRPMEGLWRWLGTGNSSVPLRLYGILEGIIGLYVLLTPALIGAIEKTYVLIASQGGFSYNALSLACFFMSFLALIIPTTCMGATLPVISKFLIHSREELGGKLGGIYSLNTAGAVIGSALAGFVLLSVFGVRISLLAGALINIWIFFLIFYVDHVFAGEKGDDEGSASPAEEAPQAAEEPASPLPPWVFRWVILSFGFVGFSSMVYEVAWTRAICLAIGSSIYAFSIILTTFLLGIALGSAVFSLFFARRRNSITLLAWVEAAVGASSLLLTFFFGNLPFFFYKIFPLIHGSHFTIVLGDFLLCLAAMILPTALMGFAFPLVAQIYTTRFSSLGKSIGTVYSANTLGCIIGSFLAGFAFIPLFGVLGTMKVGILANLAVAFVLFLCASSVLSRGRIIIQSLLCLLLIGATFALPGWNIGVMSCGPAVHAVDWSQMDRAEFLKKIAQKPIFYRDGLSSTVSVHEAVYPDFDSLKDYTVRKKYVSLRVNGKADASNFAGDMQTQILLGYLPAILHPSPKNVAIIGLGSGITLDTIRQAPEIRRVDCAELEPAVVEANEFFSKYNHRVLTDSRVRLFKTDGRLLLLTSPERYDLIISEPSNPWIAGITNLFSVEFYRICEGRLAPGGLVCQWFHLYNMAPSDIKMILKSFYSVFPFGSLWSSGNGGDLILIGQKEDRPIDPSRLKHLYDDVPVLRQALQDLGFLSPESLLASYLMDAATARKIAVLAPLNTDDLPLLEFSAPRSIYQNTSLTNLEGLKRFKEEPRLCGGISVPAARSHLYLGIAYMAIKQREEALKEFETALSLNPTLTEARIQEGRVLMAMGRDSDAERSLLQAFSEKPQARTAYLLGLLCQRKKKWSEAESFFRRGLAISVGEEPAFKYAFLLESGRSLTKLGRVRKAENAFLKASSTQKENLEALRELALLLYRSNRLKEAQLFFQKVLLSSPGDFEALQGLGNILLKKDRYQEAAIIFREALASTPHNAEARINLAFCLLRTGKAEEAMEQYRQILRDDPYNMQVLKFLQVLMKKNGSP